MRISDWSSDVCSSDLERHGVDDAVRLGGRRHLALADPPAQVEGVTHDAGGAVPRHDGLLDRHLAPGATVQPSADLGRSEEHTSELRSIMSITYAGFWLKKKRLKVVSRECERTTVCK